MSESRYRVIFTLNGELRTHEIMLESENPGYDISYWLEEEYQFRAYLKEIWWLRDDGVAEQIS